MIHAYCIMAHANPDQLSLLIDRLLGPGTPDRVVLHLDARSALWRDQRARFARHPSDRVTLAEPPVGVLWAHWTIVAAQHRLLQAALAGPFDMLHLLSGADWPVTTRAAIERELGDAGPLPVHIDFTGPVQQQRLDDWWFDDRKLAPRSWHPSLVENLDRAQTRLSWSFSRHAPRFGVRRPRYRGHDWIKGSAWWSLPRDVAAMVEREMAAMLCAGRLRFTQCADEHVVQTIVAANLPTERLRGDRRFISWGANPNSPENLTRARLNEVRDSNSWFARKFDLATDDFFLRDFAPFA